MKSKVNAFCVDKALLCKDARLLCAVSGGADSMAMLHLLHTNKEYFGLGEVCACHLNHGLRGNESDAEEQMVRNFCKMQGIELICENADMTNLIPPAGVGLEELARTLRYDFFERAAEQLSCSLVATAHTATDQAETVLFRIARGSGLLGAAGIPAKRGMYVRPLLCVERKDTEAYCGQNAVPFCVDSSNLTDEFARNRIRHHALPALESVNEDYAQAISRFSDIALKADAFFTEKADEQIKSLAKVFGESTGYDVSGVSALSEIEQQYFLIRLFQKNNLSADYSLVERCKGILFTASKIQLSGDFYLIKRGNFIFIEKIEPKSEFCAAVTEGENETPFNKTFSVVKKGLPPINEKFSKDLFLSSIDCDKVVGTLFLRNRTAGDIFSSAVRKNTKSVKKILSEKHLSLAERDSLLVVCDDEGIVWLEGEGPSARAAITKNTKNIYNFKVLKGK